MLLGDFNSHNPLRGSEHRPWASCLGRSEKQVGRPSLWLAETFSTSSLKTLNRIYWILTGSKNSTSSTKFVLLGQIGKMRWLSWSLIGWDIFDLIPLWNCWTEFAKTWQEARTQHPLPCLCFSAIWKTKMVALTSDWLRHCRLFLWNHWMKFDETWQLARILWFLYTSLQMGRIMVWWCLSGSLSVTVFHTFFLHALMYWAEILCRT